ncbi:MAG: ABC transporter ATP-binding protein [Thermoplasmataceae archaeon]|jgi:peptide/nickel transport system ATP-binding protein
MNEYESVNLSDDFQDKNSEEFVLKFNKVEKIFKSGRIVNHALDNISIGIKKGETLAVVGESGSGKTTMGLAAVKLLDITRGSIFFENQDVSKLKGRKLFKFRSKTQMIFQDPYSSLNPFNTIYKSVSAPLVSFRKDLNHEKRRDLVAEMLDRVGLQPGRNFLDVFPKSLSGGQRQRVSIARSLIMNPSFIVADEPTSMLDVSISATVINLLKKLKSEMKFSMMYISHELATSRFIGDKMAVMNFGRVVEYGDADEIAKHPMHPYSEILINSMPSLENKNKEQITKLNLDFNFYNGGIRGCSFAHFCPFKKDLCETERPQLKNVGNEHYVACFYPLS